MIQLNKNAFCVRVMAFLTAIFTVSQCSFELATAMEEPETIWYGELDAGTRIFRYLIEASPADENSTSATLTSFDEGEAQFKLEDFSLSDKKLSFKLKAIFGPAERSGHGDGGQMVAIGQSEISKWATDGTPYDRKI